MIDLDFHGFLLTNSGTRLDRFAQALAATVREGDAVLDIGAGTGILAFLACQAGARRVYAVESDPSHALGLALASGGPYRDRIECINASSFDVVLPERVDVVVADIHSTLGLQPLGLSAILDARDRLMAPGGRLVPRSMQLLAAPVEEASLYADRIDRWRTTVHGVSLEPIRALAVNMLHSARVAPGDLLAPLEAFAAVDLAGASSLHVGGTIETRATRDGLMHGVCGGFLTTLAQGVELDNLPGAAASTNFAHTLLPLDEPIAVGAGDTIAIRIDLFDGVEVRWAVEVTAAGGAVRRAEHATFRSLPLSRDTLTKRDPLYRPTLTDTAAIERALLDQFDGTRTATELGAWLEERYGKSLTAARAADLLSRTIDRCG